MLCPMLPLGALHDRAISGCLPFEWPGNILVVCSPTLLVMQRPESHPGDTRASVKSGSDCRGT